MLKLIILQLVRPILMITGGTEIDSIEERPFQVAINVDYIPFFDAHCPCGGTIISKNYVLTAAHCLRHSSDPNYYVVRVNTRKSEWWGFVYKVENLTVHPDYTNGTMRHDIGLLKLKDDLKFGKGVQPILLPGKNFTRPFGLRVKASGYGADVMNGTALGYLKEIELGTIDMDECSIYVDNLLQNQICAISFESSRGAGMSFH